MAGLRKSGVEPVVTMVIPVAAMVRRRGSRNTIRYKNKGETDVAVEVWLNASGAQFISEGVPGGSDVYIWRTQAPARSEDYTERPITFGPRPQTSNFTVSYELRVHSMSTDPIHRLRVGATEHHLLGTKSCYYEKTDNELWELKGRPYVVVLQKRS